MSGVFSDPEALESQDAAIAARRARKHAQRLTDAREGARVAARIRAAYEERLSLPSGYDQRSEYLRPYPWQD
jgi:hypothetical protein